MAGKAPEKRAQNANFEAFFCGFPGTQLARSESYIRRIELHPQPASEALGVAAVTVRGLMLDHGDSDREKLAEGQACTVIVRAGARPVIACRGSASDAEYR
jgi:hypothetical protein